jgi:aspartate/methionine/tyrosine aminotransferase
MTAATPPPNGANVPEPAATPRLTTRCRDIEPFHAVAIFREAVAMAGDGRGIIMSVGEPDFDTPHRVRAAAVAALERGETHYTVPLGIPPLRDAIAGMYAERYGASVDASRIAVTVGASGALALLFGILAEPGDEFLLADPGYPSNRALLTFCGATATLVPVGPAERFQLTPELVERSWGPRTRGVMVASPANPTGTTIPHEGLVAIHEVVQRRGGVLIVDEIYHGLTYGHRPPSAVSLGEDVYVVNSFSKYYCMTGWRLGWLVAPSASMEAIERLAQHLFIAPPAPSQWAAIAALEPESTLIYEAQRAELERRRDFVVPALNDLGLTVACPPDGAFYAYADCSAHTDDSWTFARELLHDARIAITPGRDFGTHRAHEHVRLSYTCPLPRLEESVDRIRQFLSRRRG